MKVGLIINPIAGMGGAVGLKGTDGKGILEKARQLGAQPHATERALSALRIIAARNKAIQIFCLSGEMGEDSVIAAGLHAVVIGTPDNPQTTPADTWKAAQELLLKGIDLLMFVGGDGTARDIEQSIGQKLPVIGIPAGVKMYSSVFANSPQEAGQLAIKYLMGEVTALSELEVMDIDEESYRTGAVATNLFGYLKVPAMSRFIQGPKVPMQSEDDSVKAIVQRVIQDMDSDFYYIIGPGTTTQAIMQTLGLDCTLVGVDVIKEKNIIQLDVCETLLIDLTSKGNCKILVTPIGGQAHLFGRGNQQISDVVIKQVGIDNILIVATPAKLASLRGKSLRVDLNNREVEAQFPTYLKVITGYNDITVYSIMH